MPYFFFTESNSALFSNYFWKLLGNTVPVDSPPLPTWSTIVNDHSKRNCKCCWYLHSGCSYIYFRLHLFTIYSK